MLTIKRIVMGAFIAAMALACLAECVPSWADPCSPPQGWTGEIVGYDGQHQFVLTDSNLYYAAYNSQQYIFEFLPGYNQLLIPYSAITSATFDIPTCTYHVEYDDIVFTNDFEP